MSSFRLSYLKSVLFLTASFSVVQLIGCKESAKKADAPKAAAKTSSNSLPSIPATSFPDAAKERMALQEVSPGLWTLESFSSVTQAIDSKDQLYIASAFVPTAEKFLSECNATGKFAAVLLKNPGLVKSIAQIPTQIDSSAKEPFKSVFTLRYGAIVDQVAVSCTPTIEWMKPTNAAGVVDLLSGLNENNLVEKVSEKSGAKLQAALTQSKDELVLHYKTEGKEVITITKFVYTRDANPVAVETKSEAKPEVNQAEPATKEVPAPKEDPALPVEPSPDLPYGVHN